MSPYCDDVSRSTLDIAVSSEVMRLLISLVSSLIFEMSARMARKCSSTRFSMFSVMVISFWVGLV